jgi:uncharacterized protein
MTAAVSGLALTPVKATRLRSVESITLGPEGVRENRRFYLIDAEDRMVNGTRLGSLQTVTSYYDDAERKLRLEFADGRVLEGELSLGPVVQTHFYSALEPARLVEGPWSEALSEVAGKRLRLVEAGEAGGVDRGPTGTATLISRASVERIAKEGGSENVDSRRFRMLIEVDGVGPHAEDEWVGGSVRVGDAVIRFEGHVGRCVITTRNPDSGVVDFPTLKLLGRYRRHLDTTEPLPFGIYGRVVEPGAIRVGDAVALEG